MTAFEKLQVNRSAKSLGHVRRGDAILVSIDVIRYRDVHEIGGGSAVISVQLRVEHWINVTGIHLDETQIGIARERCGEHQSLHPHSALVGC